MRQRRVLAVVLLLALVGAGVLAARARWTRPADASVDAIDVVAQLRDDETASWTADWIPRDFLQGGFGALGVERGEPVLAVSGPEARLKLPRLPTPRPVEIRLRVSAPTPQQVGLRVEGQDLASFDVGPTPTEVAWTVPRRQLRRVGNQVMFTSAGGFRVHALAVRQVGPARTRDDQLLLGGPSVARLPVRCRGTCTLEVAALEGALDVGFEPDPGEGIAAPAPLRLEAAGSLPLPIGPDVAGFLVLSAPAGGRVVVTRPRFTDRFAAPERPPHVAVDRGRPDIFLYVMDTTRADRLGFLGYGTPTTPFLDELVRDGAVAYSLESVASWTRPSMATMFTGLGYDAHRIHDYDGGLPPGAPFVPEALSAAGYATRAFVTNGHIRRTTGFARGFDWFDEDVGKRAGKDGPFWVDKRRIEDVLPVVTADLAAQPTDRPLFVYLHSMGPHDPYQPPAEARAAVGVPPVLPEIDGVPLDSAKPQVDYIMDVGMRKRPFEPEIAAALSHLYDAEIHAEDAHLRALVAALKARGRWDDTLFVLVGDHGEALGEHQTLGHERNLHHELLAVPLLLKLPAGWAAPRATGLSSMDIAPTLLDAAGLPPFDGAIGRSVFVGGTGDTPVVSATLHRHIALHEGRYKLMTDRQAAWTHLYDAESDPFETRDLAAARPARAEVMRRELWRRLRADQVVGTRLGAVVAVQDEDDLEELRALGYVE